MGDNSEKTDAADTSVKFTQHKFYGRNKSATLPVSIRIKRRLRELEGKHIPTAYKSRLIGPCSSWKIFHRQKEAFDFVTSQSEDLRVWCYESEVFVARSGQRLFLAASVQQFWHYYSQLPPAQRHHYEVIPEGAPCHLYFDLEYRTDCNPGIQGPRMVDLFIQLICYHLQKHYRIRCTKEHILQLDASIPSKFSQHLIFHLNDAAFRNNAHAGGFVDHVCSNLEDILHEAPAATHTTPSTQEEAVPPSTPAAGPHPPAPATRAVGPHPPAPATRAGGPHPPAPATHAGGPHPPAPATRAGGPHPPAPATCAGGPHPSAPATCAGGPHPPAPATRAGGPHPPAPATCAGGPHPPAPATCAGGPHPPAPATRAGGPHPSAPATCAGGPHPAAPATRAGGPHPAAPATRAGGPHPAAPATRAGGPHPPAPATRAGGPSDSCPPAPLQLLLREAGLTAEDIKSLFVKDKRGKQVLFCDRGVYTRNRNFRLYLSSKLGKTNPLVVAEDNTRPCPPGSPQQQQLFLDSLVSVVRPSANLRLLSWENSDDANTISTPSQHTRQHKVSAEGYCTASPYPEVDRFVTSVVTSDGRHGNIRRWSYLEDAEMLIYDIAGNRWCHNVGRQHRSNNIMMLADLQRAMYYQKCHDPDCKAANFKSQDWPLPKEILPSRILDKDGDFPDVTNNTLQRQDDADSISDDVLRHMNMELRNDEDTLGDGEWEQLEVEGPVWEQLAVREEVLVAEAESLMEASDDAALVAAAAAVEDKITQQ